MGRSPCHITSVLSFLSCGAKVTDTRTGLNPAFNIAQGGNKRTLPCLSHPGAESMIVVDLVEWKSNQNLDCETGSGCENAMTQAKWLNRFYLSILKRDARNQREYACPMGEGQDVPLDTQGERNARGTRRRATRRQGWVFLLGRYMDEGTMARIYLLHCVNLL